LTSPYGALIPLSALDVSALSRQLKFIIGSDWNKEVEVI